MLLISWVGLLGAVTIVFATYPLLAGGRKSSYDFQYCFFLSLTFVLIQGTTLPIVAKWLNLALPEKAKQRTLTDIELSESIKSLMTEIIIPPVSSVTGKPLVELGFPKTTLISIIQRKGKFITPNGSTILEPNDKLDVISENKEAINKIFDCLEIKDRA